MKKQTIEFMAKMKNFEIWAPGIDELSGRW